MDRLDSISAKEGLYSFMTESNSLYQVRVSKDERTLIRTPQGNDSKRNLRKDNQEIKIVGEFSIVVGEAATFILEPLGDLVDGTIRITNIVKIITYIH
ncbi:hypothetical protein [Bacillus coahuilensis]|uniref:hypothetical protein n=1 Tax=Bacillus coahuilensis TaxID=408580 RepID=UPI0001850A4F|nr:hypothetical protein [Bacillus coahuilensis]